MVIRCVGVVVRVVYCAVREVWLVVFIVEADVDVDFFSVVESVGNVLVVVICVDVVVYVVVPVVGTENGVVPSASSRRVVGPIRVNSDVVEVAICVVEVVDPPVRFGEVDSVLPVGEKVVGVGKYSLFYGPWCVLIFIQKYEDPM